MLATLYNAESNLQSKVKIVESPPLGGVVNPPLRGFKYVLADEMRVQQKVS